MAIACNPPLFRGLGLFAFPLLCSQRPISAGCGCFCGSSGAATLLSKGAHHSTDFIFGYWHGSNIIPKLISCQHKNHASRFLLFTNALAAGFLGLIFSSTRFMLSILAWL